MTLHVSCMAWWIIQEIIYYLCGLLGPHLCCMVLEVGDQFKSNSALFMQISCNICFFSSQKYQFFSYFYSYISFSNFHFCCSNKMLEWCRCQTLFYAVINFSIALDLVQLSRKSLSNNLLSTSDSMIKGCTYFGWSQCHV